MVKQLSSWAEFQHKVKFGFCLESISQFNNERVSYVFARLFRDVSFLYDVPVEHTARPKPDEYDPTEIRRDEEENEAPKKKVPKTSAIAFNMCLVRSNTVLVLYLGNPIARQSHP